MEEDLTKHPTHSPQPQIRRMRRATSWITLTKNFSKELLRRINQRLVNHGAALIFKVRTRRSQQSLNHSNKDQIGGRVDPEPRARRAIPEKRALSIRQTCFRRIEFHGAVIAVAESRPHHLQADPKLPGQQLHWHMIRAHQLHARWRQYA